MAFQIHHINCGTMCPVGGRLVSGVAGQPAKMVCHCLVIETDAGLVLVDTGLGLADLEHPRERLGKNFARTTRLRLDPAETAVRQIEALGFSPADVRHIVLTHMDLDHAGGLGDFPDAVVHVAADEHAVATAPKSFRDRFRYKQVQWSHSPTWATHNLVGEPWRGFAAARDLPGLPPELLLLSLPGHSPGHAGLAIDTGSGWLVHAGDAYFFHAEVDPESPTCPPFLRAFQRLVQHDGKARFDTQARLRDLVRQHPDITIFCAHDPKDLARLQSAAALAQEAAAAEA